MLTGIISVAITLASQITDGIITFDKFDSSAKLWTIMGNE